MHSYIEHVNIYDIDNIIQPYNKDTKLCSFFNKVHHTYKEMGDSETILIWKYLWQFCAFSKPPNSGHLMPQENLD